MIPSTQPAIPVIDIGPLSSANVEDRRGVAAEINAACLRSGFFYIQNHGIPQGLIEAVESQAKAFFDLPDAEKDKINRTKSICNRGWEALRSQALEVGGQPDLKESLYIGRDLPLDHPAVVAKTFNHGPNQWPDGLHGFKATMRAYHEAMVDLGERMMGGLALALSLEESYFDAFARDSMTTLRLLHYPPQPADAHADQRGAGAHTDFGTLTFLLQDANGGLQVRDPASGAWIDAPPIAGTYVVNLGDTISRWTNDRYRSTLHRVINRSGRERYSVPFFFSGNADHVVSCLPGCTAPGEQPKYKANTVAGHMAEMYGRSYALAS